MGKKKETIGGVTLPSGTVTGAVQRRLNARQKGVFEKALKLRYNWIIKLVNDKLSEAEKDYGPIADLEGSLRSTLNAPTIIISNMMRGGPYKGVPDEVRDAVKEANKLLHKIHSWTLNFQHKAAIKRLAAEKNRISVISDITRQRDDAVVDVIFGDVVGADAFRKLLPEPEDVFKSLGLTLLPEDKRDAPSLVDDTTCYR